MTREHEAQQRPPSRIPEFKSIEEEAEWWDTHDLSDFWDELRPVNVRVAKNLSEGVTVRLDPRTLDQLRERARAKGLGPSTLARMWIIEKLRDEAGRTAGPR